MKNEFEIYQSGNQLFSNSQKAITLAQTKKLGEIKSGKVIYSYYEALYLQELKKAYLVRIRIPIQILIFYPIFRDLRKKGYIVKEGLKFGGEFRVYEKNNQHAKWIALPINSSKINLKEFISKNRITHSTGKKLLLAIIDSQEDINYYETDWIKL
jgi:tRNA-intron endonuclease